HRESLPREPPGGGVGPDFESRPRTREIPRGILRAFSGPALGRHPFAGRCRDLRWALGGLARGGTPRRPRAPLRAWAAGVGRRRGGGVAIPGARGRDRLGSDREAPRTAFAPAYVHPRHRRRRRPVPGGALSSREPSRSPDQVSGVDGNGVGLSPGRLRWAGGDPWRLVREVGRTVVALG